MIGVIHRRSGFLFVCFWTCALSRCCKYDIHGPEAYFWDDLESKIMECVRNTLDRRVQFYEDEIRKLTEQRFMPVWNFCNFFILKVIPFLKVFQYSDKCVIATSRNAWFGFKLLLPVVSLLFIFYLSWKSLSMTFSCTSPSFLLAHKTSVLIPKNIPNNLNGEAQLYAIWLSHASHFFSYSSDSSYL